MSATTISRPSRVTWNETTTTGRMPFKVRTKVAPRVQVTLGVAMAMTYLLAVGSQQDQIAAIAIIAGAGMAVLFPVAGLSMFVIIMPMRETEVFAPIRVNALMAGAISLGCLLRWPFDRFPLKVHPGIVLLVGYVVISALSTLPVLSGHPSEWTSTALNQLLRLSTGVALFLSAMYLFRSISPGIILGLALVGATLAALLAIGGTMDVLPFEAVSRGLVEEGGGTRAGGPFANPNFLALYIASAAVFALGLLAVARRRQKLGLAPIVILLFACLVFAYSRGQTLGAIAGIVVLAAMWNRAAGLAILVVAAIAAFTLYPAFLEARQGAALSPMDVYAMGQSEYSRASVAVAALAMFAAFPVFGAGFGAFQFVSPSFGELGSATYSHNLYLQILGEQGVVGILLIAGIIAMLAIALRRSRSPLRWAALAMAVTYLVGSLFINSMIFQSSGLVWIVMAAALSPGPDPAPETLEA